MQSTAMEEDSSDRESLTKDQLRRAKYFRKRKKSSCNDSDTQQQSCRPPDRKMKGTKARKKKTPETPSVNTEPVPEARAEEDTTVMSVKDSAERIHCALLEFLSTPERNVPGDVPKFVMTKVTKLQGLLTESLLRTSHLEGQTAALQAENYCQRKTFEATTENHPPKATTTYAGRIGIKSRTAESSNLKQDPSNVVTILPKDVVAFDSSEKTKEAVFQLVSPRKDKIQVKNVRRIQGNGIIIETANKVDISTLLTNEKLKAAGLIVGAPEKRNPRIRCPAPR